MWRLINVICHVDALSAAPMDSQTYVNEGERNVGRIVKSEVWMAAHELYQEMEREYMANVVKNNREGERG